MTNYVPVYSQSDKLPNTSPCVVCGVALSHYTNYRKIPDYLCLKCYRLYESSLNEPWLKFLMNKERSRRQKRQRLVKRGIFVEEISLDNIIDSGLDIKHG